MILPVLIFASSVLAVCSLNRQHYGLFAITEYDSPVFLKAYGSLTRVKPETWQPLIPVAAETRQRIYAVSPAFRQLEPWLEGDIGMLYARYGETVKNNGREMGGGWFHIALRESIEAAGLTAAGKFPADYYRQLTAEIDSACRSGELDCGPARSSFMAVWNKAYLSPLVKNSWLALKYMLAFDGYDGQLKECLGTDEQLKPFIDLTHETCRYIHPSVIARGWVVKPGRAISIWIYDSSGKKVVSPTYHMYSPDLAELFRRSGLNAPEAAVARFQIEADCSNGCELVVKDSDGSILRKIALVESIGTGDQPDENGLYYRIESVEWHSGEEAVNPIRTKINAWKSRGLQILARIYQKGVPALAILSVLLFIYQTILLVRKRGDPVLWMIESSLLAVIVTRLVMVAWLESSSIDAIITTYLSPNHPLLLVFLGLTCSWMLLHYRGLGRWK